MRLSRIETNADTRNSLPSSSCTRKTTAERKGNIYAGLRCFTLKPGPHSSPACFIAFQVARWRKDRKAKKWGCTSGVAVGPS